jgi:hypothetical protein
LDDEAALLGQNLKVPSKSYNNQFPAKSFRLEEEEGLRSNFFSPFQTLFT